MSVTATSNVWDHYTGKPTLKMVVLLAVADVANDLHDYEFWASAGAVARKVNGSRPRVTEALAELVIDGWLVVLERPPGKPVKYRFVLQGVPIGNTPEVSPSGTPPVPNGHTPGTLPLTQGTEEQNQAVRRADAEELFDRIWKVYPVKEGKQKCRQRFLRAKPSDRENWRKAFIHYLTFLKAHPERPPMHMTTFLNGRWSDWVDGPPAQGQPPTPAAEAKPDLGWG